MMSDFVPRVWDAHEEVPVEALAAEVGVAEGRTVVGGRADLAFTFRDSFQYGWQSHTSFEALVWHVVVEDQVANGVFPVHERAYTIIQTTKGGLAPDGWAVCERAVVEGHLLEDEALVVSRMVANGRGIRWTFEQEL